MEKYNDLRDQFAMAALSAVINDWCSSMDIFKDAEVADCIARDAYIVADAMMVARLKTECEMLTVDEIAELTSIWSLAKNPSPFELARMVEEKFMEKNKW